MPITQRQLEREIHQAGCSIQRTGKGHYLVLDQDGNPIEGYAVTHGKGGKRGEVHDYYVRKVRKALEDTKPP